jgi:hypothetical protein
VLRGVDDDCSQGKGAARFIAWITGEMDASRLFIDMRNPQILECRIGVGQAAGKEFPRRCKAVELQREFGTLIPHPGERKRRRSRGLFEPHPKR